MADIAFTDTELGDIEVRHPEGLSSDAIVGLLSSKGIRLTEATLRKWVQLGLLPRSRRVGLPGGLPGSVGLYPATVVRRILKLKVMMAEYTIEEIKHHFLFVRGDVEELERTLARIFGRLTTHVGERGDGDVQEASRLATELVDRICKIEGRLQHS